MARSAEHGAAAVLAALLLLAAQPAVQQGTSIQLPCTTSDDCDTQGAVCSAGLCTCASGQVMTSDLTRCLPGAGEWGAACSDAVQCVSRLLVGGSCSPAEVITSALAPPQPAVNVCQCAQGYHYLRGQCWRSAGLGESCKHSENCYANHDSESVTCQDSKCVCAAGFYQREYSSCRRISTEYGQECGIDQDCQYEFSACPDRKCACQTGYKFDKTAKKCSPAPKAPRLESRAALNEADEVAPAVAWQALFGTKKAVSKRAAVGDDLPAAAACTSASDCGAHSDCESGACVCQRGYFKLDGETTCHPELLQTCAQDTDCTMKYAICRASGDTKACSCKGGYIASKDMRICRKMSRALAWSCLHDEQCGYFGPGASCESKRCACAAGTHWVQAQKYCWVSRAVGEQCSAPEDCAGLGEGGECGWSNADGEVQGDGGASACRCGDGFHAAADGASCRVNADGVGARCEQDEDCVTAHTACAANACACVAGYTTDASGKGCQTGVGGPCAADSDCAAAGSQCVQSKCACPDGRVPSKSGDACLNSVVTLNGTCTETAQCALLNAQCTEGACQCDEDQHFRDGRCQRKTGLGERCATTSECYLAEDPERAECRNGLCKCGFQFTNVDNKECSGSSAASGRAAAASMSVLAAACVSLSLGRRG